MCGRFRLSRSKEIIAEHFDIADEVVWSPRFNIASAQMVAVVRQNPERPIRWGLIPFWAKDANIGFKMINARAETVAEKPAYWESFKSRRCLISRRYRRSNSGNASPRKFCPVRLGQCILNAAGRDDYQGILSMHRSG